MKNYFAILSLIVAVSLVSCSETESEVSKEEKVEKQKEVVKKPLMERSPKVKDYIGDLDEIVEEYLTVGEELLTLYEKNSTQDLELDEQMNAMMTMFKNAEKISLLNNEIADLEKTRLKIEEDLDGDDIAEFGIMIAGKMDRFLKLVERINKANILELAGY